MVKKRVLLALLAGVMILGGCQSENKSSQSKENPNETKKEIVQVVVPDGLPAITISKMIKENPVLDENVEVKYSVEKGPDGLASKVLGGEADIAIVPSNLAAQSYNKGLGYKLVATGGFGSFSLIGQGEIKTLEDIKGKEITTIGKGLTPDIVLKSILKEKGINPDSDVTLNYLSGATELAPTFLAGKTQVAQMPEPMLTKVLKKKTDTNIIMNLNEEWKNTFKSKNGFPQSSLIIKKDLIENNKKFVEKFIDEYENSIKFANENTDKLGEYVEATGISIEKEILKDAIKGANLKFVSAEDGKEDYEKYFEVLMKYDSKVIGGKLPDEEIYFKK